jgi:aspartyl protease
MLTWEPTKTDYAETINSMFVPPARWDNAEGLFFVECNAKPPQMIFNIGGKNITSDPTSMILPQLQKNGLCATGVTTMGDNQELYILGDTFMQELVVVFDISEKMEVRIANKI